MISRVTLIKVSLRSFFIQSSWNFERMQNLGICFSLLPGLREIYKSKETLGMALSRHLEFFNTHPYMASPIIGATLRLEEDVLSGNESSENVKAFKNGTMGSCGAIGDAFFWGALKPFASILAFFAAAAGQLYSPLVLLLVFNVPHIKTRFSGVFDGYRDGIKILDRIKSRNFVGATEKLRFATAILAGITLAFVVDSGQTLFFSDETWSAFALAGFFSVFYFLIKKGMSLIKMIYISAFLSIAMSVLL